MSDAAARPASVVPLPAASLIIVRQGGQGMEVLVGRRGGGARAFPGATVFPGGKLEAHDTERLHAGAAADHVARYAALRETFEETGLLISDAGDGPPRGVDIGAAREAVEAGTLRFADLLGQWKIRPGTGRLTTFAHWVTPQNAPYRFDTAFFLLAASAYEAEAPLICAEFDDLRWALPSLLLREDGRRLMTPTRHCLQVLSESKTPVEAVAAAQAHGPIEGHAARMEVKG